MAQIIDLREGKEKQFHSTHILNSEGLWINNKITWERDSSEDIIITILTDNITIVQDKDNGQVYIYKGEWK